MKITVKKLSGLKPLEKNVRRHNEKQISEYARSLTRFGQIRPMVVDEEGVILIGNGMYEAMKRLGWESAACETVTGLSGNDKKKLMLADNRVYELGMTDMDAFEEIIRELDGDFDIPGWDDDLLETLTASIAEATEMVQNYGVFSAEEVAAVRERRREDHASLPGQQAASAPLQRSVGSTEESGPVSDSPAPPPSTSPAEARTARTVTCPHCGESIDLEQIGGV